MTSSTISNWFSMILIKLHLVVLTYEKLKANVNKLKVEETIYLDQFLAFNKHAI